MPRTALTCYVTGCKDCPFAQHRLAYCTLHSERIDVGPYLAKADSPPACPLRARKCTVSSVQQRLGRPVVEKPLRPTFAAESAHFLAWLREHGLGVSVSALARMNAYAAAQAPPLKPHHLRKALAGERPFHEHELDKAVAYAKAERGYTGYPAAG